MTRSWFLKSKLWKDVANKLSMACLKCCIPLGSKDIVPKKRKKKDQGLVVLMLKMKWEIHYKKANGVVHILMCSEVQESNRI